MHAPARYKPVLNIVLLFLFSWVLSYLCSLALTKVTFNISHGNNVHLNSGDYLLFLSGDNQEVLLKFQSELENISFLEANESVVDIPINKREGLSFPVRVGIKPIECVGLIRIKADGNYRLGEAMPADTFHYVLADVRSFRVTFSLVLVIGIFVSLLLFVLFLINVYKIVSEFHTGPEVSTC